MSIADKSLGPFYVSLPPVTQRVFAPHVGDVTEMCAPWRRGRVLVLCTLTHRALALGWWTRDINDDIEVDFANPAWMKLLGDNPNDISKWSNGETVAQEPNGEPE